MFGHVTPLSAMTRTLLRSTLVFCTAVAFCMAAPLAAPALDRTGAMPVATIHDAACLGDNPIALASDPTGRFLFAIDQGGTVCRIRTTDLSPQGTTQVNGGFATSRPHVEFTPNGASMLVNGAQGVAVIDVNDLTTTLHPSTGRDYMLSSDGVYIGVIEPADANGGGDGDVVSHSWTLRTFSTASGGGVEAVPLRHPDGADDADSVTVIHDVTPYTTNSSGTVWFVGVDDAIDDGGGMGDSGDVDGVGDKGTSLRLMAVDIATGVMDDIADDVSPTVYAIGTANRRMLYVGTDDARVLSVDVDSYDSESATEETTVVRTMFEQHLPLDRILIAQNGARLLVGMTDGRLVADEGTMQWLDMGDLISAINPDGTLLYSIDRGSGADNDTGTMDDAFTLRVNTFDRNDPTVTRMLTSEPNDGEDGSGDRGLSRSSDLSGTAFDHAAGWTFAQDGGIWYVLLTPSAGSARSTTLVAMDVSSFTTESVSRSMSESAGRRSLNTTTIAITVAVAVLLVAAIIIVRRRTSW